MKNLAVRLAKARGYKNPGPTIYHDYIGEWVLIQIISRRNKKTNTGTVITSSKEYSPRRLSYAKKRAKELSKELGIPYVEFSEWR